MGIDGVKKRDLGGRSGRRSGGLDSLPFMKPSGGRGAGTEPAFSALRQLYLMANTPNALGFLVTRLNPASRSRRRTLRVTLPGILLSGFPT